MACLLLLLLVCGVVNLFVGSVYELSCAVVWFVFLCCVVVGRVGFHVFDCVLVRDLLCDVVWFVLFVVCLCPCVLCVVFDVLACCVCIILW